jgi:uncharacterized protein YndB with AHSA1/START domain
MNRFFYAIYIKTTPKKLWNALIDPEFTKQYWWGRRLESDWKVGSEIKALYDRDKIDWQGKILEYKPLTRLSYSFHLEGVSVLNNNEPSVVIFEIAAAGKSVVKLTLSHEKLSDKEFKDVSDGWPMLLSCFKSLLESGKALKYETT